MPEEMNPNPSDKERGYLVEGWSIIASLTNSMAAQLVANVIETEDLEGEDAAVLEQVVEKINIQITDSKDLSTNMKAQSQEMFSHTRYYLSTPKD